MSLFKKKKTEEKEHILHPKFPCYGSNGKGKITRITKIAISDFPTYYENDGVLYIDIFPQIEACFFIPVMETKAELLAMFNKDSHEE